MTPLIRRCNTYPTIGSCPESYLKDHIFPANDDITLVNEDISPESRDEAIILESRDEDIILEIDDDLPEVRSTRDTKEEDELMEVGPVLSKQEIAEYCSSYTAVMYSSKK